MKKEKMMSLLLRKEGLGVKVVPFTEKESVNAYYFYEDLEESKGIERIKEHLLSRKDLRVTIFTTKWAKQADFLQYFDYYVRVKQICDKYPDYALLEQRYQIYQEHLIAKLQKYTGFSFQKAREQILCCSVSLNKFTNEPLM